MSGTEKGGLHQNLEALITLVDAMDFLWSVFGAGEERPATWRASRKIFPEGDDWYWAKETLSHDERIADELALELLDARWTLLERVFYAHEKIAPFIRECGDDRPPRPAEAWEWSCIGLHALWEGWRHPRGEVRAELSAAHFSADDEGARESRELMDYELYFLYDRVRDFRDHLLGGSPPPNVKTNPTSWSEVVAAYAETHGFGEGDDVNDLLDGMVWEGLAVDDGSTVVLKVGPSSEARVSVADFETAASVAILRCIAGAGR